MRIKALQSDSTNAHAIDHTNDICTATQVSFTIPKHITAQGIKKTRQYVKELFHAKKFTVSLYVGKTSKQKF